MGRVSLGPGGREPQVPQGSQKNKGGSVPPDHRSTLKREVTRPQARTYRSRTWPGGSRSRSRRTWSATATSPESGSFALEWCRCAFTQSDGPPWRTGGESNASRSWSPESRRRLKHAYRRRWPGYRGLGRDGTVFVCAGRYLWSGSWSAGESYPMRSLSLRSSLPAPLGGPLSCYSCGRGARGVGGIGVRACRCGRGYPSGGTTVCPSGLCGGEKRCTAPLKLEVDTFTSLFASNLSGRALRASKESPKRFLPVFIPYTLTHEHQPGFGDTRDTSGPLRGRWTASRSR